MAITQNSDGSFSFTHGSTTYGPFESREQAATARRRAAKDTGTVRFADGDIIVVADLPRRVVWDQAKLAAMVERIRAAGDDPAEYVEISFKVAERNYAAWPAAIRQGFEPARTVRPGQLSIQLLADGARG